MRQLPAALNMNIISASLEKQGVGAECHCEKFNFVAGSWLNPHYLNETI